MVQLNDGEDKIENNESCASDDISSRMHQSNSFGTESNSGDSDLNSQFRGP